MSGIKAWEEEEELEPRCDVERWGVQKIMSGFAFLSQTRRLTLLDRRTISLGCERKGSVENLFLSPRFSSGGSGGARV